MARRQASPLLGASEPDQADVTRRDLMVSIADGNSRAQSSSLHQPAAVRDAEAQRTGAMSPV
jgi:hypothetical protein